MPYRDAGHDAVLRARREDLVRELQAVDACIRERRRRAPLPIAVSSVTASACDAPWEEMLGDDRARRCGQCGRTVFDLAGADAAEAATLLRTHGVPESDRGGLSLVRRDDGTVLLCDCPVGWRRARSRTLRGVSGELAKKMGAAAALLLLSLLSVAAGLDLVRAREHGRAHAVRRARWDAVTLRGAAEMYLAEDPRAACPTVDDLVRAHLLRRGSSPWRDPWGNELRIACHDDEVTVSSAGLEENDVCER